MAVRRWCVRGDIPLEVDAPGLIDCRLYGQGNPGALPVRLVLHLVNLNTAGAWRTPVHDLVPVGPVRVRIHAPFRDAGWKPAARALVGGTTLPVRFDQAWCEVEVPKISDHEVLVIG